MCDIIIRKAIDADFPSIFRLASQKVKDMVSPVRKNIDMELAGTNFLRDLEAVRMNLEFKSNSNLLVATNKAGNISGYLLMATDISESTTGVEQGWIFDFCVDHNMWESQVPVKLLHRAEEIAGERGLSHMALQITSSDDRLLNFFKERGYCEERKRMFKELLRNKHRNDSGDIIDVYKGVKFIIKLNE